MTAHNDTIDMPVGVRVLRFDATSGAVVVGYRLEGNVWRMLHLEPDELRVLLDAGPALTP